MAAVNVHLHELAEVIGPRPAATDAEARAADYIEAVFRARGLETVRQEFLTPRTYTWSFVLYHVLTLASVAATGVRVFRWPALAVSLIAAALMWLELDTRWGLIDLMPKGPSQNVIGRYVPRARRGERVRKVIVVAHYDSARASLAFSPAMVKNFTVSFGLMKAVTFGVPVMILASALPFTRAAQPGLWYATIAFAAYLVLPLFINIHRELFMRPVDGANDNASGVAAMLGVMERLVPESDDYVAPRAEVAAESPAPVPPDEQGLLSYPPADAESSAPDAGYAGPDELAWGDVDEAPDAQGAFDLGDASSAAQPAPDGEPGADAASQESVAEWLGVRGGFDAREKGREIGSWDNFEEEEEGEDAGWKGGAAPFDAIDDPDFASTEASRIRRRVTERSDRDLLEKEVWFVATGAEEVGTRGMRAFLAEFSEELEDAFIVNIDGVGIGNVHWVTGEGMARRYQSDRRLTGAARRVVGEVRLPVRSRVYKGLSTDATPVLARRLRAMSVMAFDINGRIPNWHWRTDTADACDAETIETAVEFTVQLIGEI